MEITVLLTLQKLIRTRAGESDSDSEAEYSTKIGKKAKYKSKWRRLLFGQDAMDMDTSDVPLPPNKSAADESSYGSSTAHEMGTIQSGGSNYRTLQRYRGGNIERTLYLERNSMLTRKHFAVSVEQVSIFMTNSNTVVSFFEHSADDIELPILRRLESKDTILRSSADASMLVQAIIDAIIDLAIPVAAAYEDIISELELDVLTDPELQHSRFLYILSSELQTLKNNMQPIAAVISALRDHRNDGVCKCCISHTLPWGEG
jgi:Mg2+ and Co2+ transporter CorA